MADSAVDDMHDASVTSAPSDGSMAPAAAVGLPDRALAVLLRLTLERLAGAEGRHGQHLQPDGFLGGRREELR